MTRSRRPLRAVAAIVLAACSVLLPLGPAVRGEEWVPVAPGVDYRLYARPGPVQVHVARLDTQEPAVIIESAVAAGGLSQGFETVGEMARRYDGALVAWGGDWGPRGRVLVAINGSSFDPETTQPYGGLLHSGEYSRRYGNLAGGTGFVWTNDRRGVIRGCVDHDESSQVVVRLADGASFEIDALNLLRPDDGLILFTPQYGAATPASKGETEVVVRLDRPLAIVPPPRHADGVVLELREGSGQTPLLFDEIILSAKGRAAKDFVRALEPGERIGISQEVRDLGFGCKTEGGFEWTDAYAGIGGGFVFLRDGQIRQSDDRGATHRDPRTAVCLDARYVYFVVVDGREDSLSRGMTLDELAAFCQSELGAAWGVNQDGGGSSTMWVNGGVVNSPSDGHERAVANGLLMMAVEPPAHSRRFDLGFTVRVQTEGPVLLGPDPRLGVFGTAISGDTVRIAPTAEGLMGIFAAGSFWWKVEHSGELGWVPEQMLISGEQALSLFELPAPPREIPSAEATEPAP